MSILFLTVHKAASTFINAEVLPFMAIDQGLELCDPFAGAHRAGLGEDTVSLDHYAVNDHLLLGPVRAPGSILDLAKFDHWTKLLLLRDPRDMLVSWYFHKIRFQSRPDGTLPLRDAKRERALRYGIDAMVYHMAWNMIARYRDYRIRFAGLPNLTLLLYEDMVADWPAFVDQLARALHKPPSDTWRRGMLAHASKFEMAGEQHGEHRRQIAAGDHLRKLQPRTIAKLDKIFADEFKWLGYDCHQMLPPGLVAPATVPGK